MRRSAFRAATAAVLTLGGVPYDAAGQGVGNLRGIIVDSRTRNPIPNVEISFVQVDFTAVTNAEGRYSIMNIPAGRYTLLVRGAGFKPTLAARHMLLPDTINILNFALDPTVEEMGEETETSARITYATTVLKGRDLPGNQELQEVLSGRLLRDRLSRLGRDRDVLWVIDGTVIPPPLTFAINTSDVLCVEVRRGSAAALPFSRNVRVDRSYSGVIIVWTSGSRTPMPEDCR